MMYAVMFAAILGAFELVQGTSAYFVGCVFLYIMIATVAFNAAGGLVTPSGAYVFFMATLTVIAGVVLKAIMWEAADANLKYPELTGLAEVGIVTSQLIGVFVSRRFHKKKGFLDSLLTPTNLSQVTMGCLVAGISIPFIISLIGNSDGSVGSALQRFGQFTSLAVMLGTYHTIKKTNGRRSMSMPVLIGILWTLIVGGIIGYSKEAFFIGIFAWLVVAAALRYRFSIAQLALLTCFLAGSIYYFVPYAQVGRTDRDNPNPIGTAIKNLNRIPEMRRLNEEVVDANLTRAPHYFSEGSVALERIQTIAFDDAIIASVEQDGTIGYAPIISYVLNLAPHFIFPNKPYLNWQTRYAHRIGLLADDDETTGVSFSPLAEAWLVGRWTGVLFVAPLVWIFSFVIIDSINTSVLRAPWGFYFTVVISHSAPEHALGGPIGLVFSSGLLIVTAYLTVYLMPIIGGLVLPPVRRALGAPPAVAPRPQQPSVAS